jgi:hypothetical protein
VVDGRVAGQEAGGLIVASPADAQQAYERGDFATARKQAGELADAKDSDEATRAAAKLILSRTSLDPLIVWITVACVGFFVLVVVLGLR